MKKLWYAAAVMLPGLLSAQQLPAGEAFAKVEFGRPLSSGCDKAGRSTCEMLFTPADNNGIANGMATKVSANVFFVEISRSKLSAQDELNIAGKAFKNIAASETPLFLMQDNFIIDNSSLKNIGLDSKGYNTITAGQYPLSISAEKVKITFTLSAAR